MHALGGPSRDVFLCWSLGRCCVIVNAEKPNLLESNLRQPLKLALQLPCLCVWLTREQ